MADCAKLGLSEEDDDDVFETNNEIYIDNPVKNDGRRIRRTSDVIDSLGEELIMMGDRGYSIPISPQRTSVDLGYSGSVSSSPSPFFVFPARMSVADGTSSTTDARPFNDEYNDDSENEIEAKMPVERDAEEYNMDHPKRGLAVIFNHEIFEMGVDRRTGTDIDAKRLTRAYSKLGFEVRHHSDLGYTEIIQVLSNLAKEDHSQYDCFILTIMTHGRSDGLLHSRDHLYHVDLLWKPFSSNQCPTLAGKPKLFFIQACRGTRLDSGTPLSMNPVNTTETDSAGVYKIPSQCDFLVSFSSMDGHYSWRNPEEGTWYIQALAEELEAGYEKGSNLMDIMTRVHRRVALFHESNVPYCPHKSGKKQAPMYHSSLIRNLIFKQKA